MSGQCGYLRRGKAECGEHHAGCEAHNQRGLPCGKPATPGATVCAAHGSRAMQVRSKAERRLAAERAQQAVGDLVQLGSDLSLGEIYRSILGATSQAIRWHAAMGERVERLNAIRYEAFGTGTEQLRAEVALYERSMDRVVKFAETIVRLDIESRRVRLAEAEALLVAEVIRRVLEALDLSAEQRALIPVVVPRELRRLGEEGQ